MPTPPPESGPTLDRRFKLGKVIGRGPSGVVYAATDLQTNQPCTVKRLHAHFYNRGVLQKVQNDALAAAKLGHPSILAPYHVAFEQSGSIYLVTHFMQGESLLTRLQRGPLSLTAALTLFDPLAAALQAAHETGLFHGAITPTNILCVSSGRVMLTDFGMCHLRGTPKIKWGGAMGYAAPESFEEGAELCSARGDVFALGALVFECLTGQRMFSSTSLATFLASVSTPPRLGGLQPMYEHLDAVLEMACAQEPLDRFANSGALWRALQSSLLDAEAPEESAAAAPAAAPVSKAPAEAAAAAVAAAESSSDEAASWEAAALEGLVTPTPSGDPEPPKLPAEFRVNKHPVQAMSVIQMPIGESSDGIHPVSLPPPPSTSAPVKSSVRVKDPLRTTLPQGIPGKLVPAKSEPEPQPTGDQSARTRLPTPRLPQLSPAPLPPMPALPIEDDPILSAPSASTAPLPTPALVPSPTQPTPPTPTPSQPTPPAPAPAPAPAATAKAATAKAASKAAPPAPAPAKEAATDPAKEAALDLLSAPTRPLPVVGSGKAPQKPAPPPQKAAPPPPQKAAPPPPQKAAPPPAPAAAAALARSNPSLAPVNPAGEMPGLPAPRQRQPLPVVPLPSEPSQKVINTDPGLRVRGRFGDRVLPPLFWAAVGGFLVGGTLLFLQSLTPGRTVLPAPGGTAMNLAPNLRFDEDQLLKVTQQHMAQRNYQSALSAAELVLRAHPDNARARRLADQASELLRASAVYGGFLRAADQQDADTAAALYAELPADSPFRVNAWEPFTAVRGTFVTRHLNLANAALAAGDCDLLSQQLDDLRRVTDNERDPDLLQGSRLLSRCRRVFGSAAVANANNADVDDKDTDTTTPSEPTAPTTSSKPSEKSAAKSTEKAEAKSTEKTDEGPSTLRDPFARKEGKTALASAGDKPKKPGKRKPKPPGATSPGASPGASPPPDKAIPSALRNPFGP